MNTVLSSDKIRMEALNNGFKFLERGEYRQAIKFLEYADEGKMNLDDQYLNYALALAYYNIGDYKRLFKKIDKLRSIEDLNEQIENTINDIEKDIEKKAKKYNKKIEVKSIVISLEVLNTLKNALQLSNDELEKIGEDSENKFYKFLANPKVDSEYTKYYKKVENEYMTSLVVFEKIKKLYNSDQLDEIKMYKYYKNSERGRGHSLLIISLINSGIMYNMLTGNKLSAEFKNILLSSIYFYFKYSYISENEFSYRTKDDELKVIDFNKFEPQYGEYITNIKDMINDDLDDKIKNKIKKVARLFYRVSFINQKYLAYDVTFQKILKYLIETEDFLDSKQREEIVDTYTVNTDIDISDIIQISKFL